MRRSAVPIGFLASFTLIGPVGVAATPSPSLPAVLAPAAARPSLQVAAVVPAPDAALEQVAAARPGAQVSRALIGDAKPVTSPHMPTIVSGDSPWGVARQYGVPVESLAEANRLGPNSVLRGQKTLVIPPGAATPSADPDTAAARPAPPAPRPIMPAGAPTAHIVVPGDSLWKIAATYGAHIGDVMAQNGLGEDDVIKPGQHIVIRGHPSRPREVTASPVRPAAPVLEPRKGDAPQAEVKSDRSFLWPTRGVITSRFGVRRYRRHHGGIDLAAPHGTPIYATRDGVVSFSGWRNGYGLVVYVDHGGGLTAIYGHASELMVAAGQQVKRGQIIARVGCTGYCTGPHLHFEVRINDVAVNPLQYLK